MHPHSDNDNTIDVSVIIPALDEERTIGECIPKIQKVFQDLAVHGEIIIADSSSDQTGSIAQSTTVFLAGIIVVLAAVLFGVLVFMKNQPVQERAFEPLVEIKAKEPDSALWGQNFPNQWSTLQKTETNNIDTTYAGSSQFSWLERDPRQVILFAGYPFSKDYNDDRGHMNALEDVRATKRLNLNDEDPKHTPATCYSCKSSDNAGLWDEMGMAAYDKMSFNEMTPNINNPIGCSNCHEAGTMRLIVTNPALEEALEAQGKDWKTFTRQEMRTVVCANCHVEYYFKGYGKYLTFPWENGTLLRRSNEKEESLVFITEEKAWLVRRAISVARCEVFPF